jgi:hypothetical protein
MNEVLVKLSLENKKLQSVYFLFDFVRFLGSVKSSVINHLLSIVN